MTKVATLDAASTVNEHIDHINEEEMNHISEIQVPDARKDFVVTNEFELLTAVSVQLLQQGRQVKTLLLGPAGCGKTTTAEQVAARLGLPYLHLNCALIREASQLFGTREVADGRTFTRESLFTRVIEAGNAVIMLDEVNRTSQFAMNGLLSVLDGSSPYSEDLQRNIHVGENIVFFGACNIGSAYTGTFKMDKALDDRFQRRIEVSYLPVEMERQLLVDATGVSAEAASRLVTIADNVRNSFNQGKVYSQDISTRVLLSAAEDFSALEIVKSGQGPSSLKLTIANRFSDAGGGSSERNAINMEIDKQFGTWGKVSA
jgi:MoxR-like ATPase